MLIRALKWLVPVSVVIAMLLSIKGCDPCPSCSHKKSNRTPTSTGTGTSRATPTSTPTSIAVNGCIPSSSLSVLVSGKDVASYVPDGNWGVTNPNVELVPIEGTGIARATIVTPVAVNSCSSNSTTGQTVCTSNGTDVFIISGSAVSKTLTSSANATTGFSGGSCETCGVVVDATTNLAFLAIGLTPGPNGYQAIDLANDTLATPITSGGDISEDIAVDPKRKLLLSPAEDGVYELVDLTTGNVFDQTVGGVLDSAGEDCTTGIALSTSEGTGNLVITDLTQAVFTVGTGGAAGTWTAPLQTQTFPEFASLSAGTNGIAVAPNTHLGVVTGEFGGSNVGAIQLPATSGTGTPAVVDYVRLALPPLPTGGAFSTGLDPHTVTAYVSPTSNKAFAIVANFPLTTLAVIDLKAMLAATRTAGTHIVDPTVDPIATGIVRYIKVF